MNRVVLCFFVGAMLDIWSLVTGTHSIDIVYRKMLYTVSHNSQHIRVKADLVLDL